MQANWISHARTFAGEIFVGVATLALIVISAWWVDVDARIPDGDNGRHLLIAFGYLEAFRDGDYFAPITAWTEYAPLVHVVAAVGGAIAGPSVEQAVVTENLVFAPLLALGCYGAGRVTFGRAAGVLAAIFAIATPMVISLLHALMLDVAEAALVAVSVWLLLASRRFADRGYTVFAGIAVIFGFYSKQTFPFFIAGLIAVMLVRGGWRHWRNALIFAAVVLVFVQPWYFMHYFDLRGQAEGAIVGAEPMWWGGVPYPERWSYHNFTWYGWNFLNNQVFLPLAVFFFIGLAVALWRLVARRRAVGYLPELFAGAAVAYVLISLKDLDDPRYTLPVLVYVAIFGTFWLTLLPRALMLAGSTLLAAILVVNLAVFGLGRGHRIAFDTSRSIPSPIRQWTFSVVDPHGYTELGQPVRHGLGDVLEERFRRAREMGFERIVFQPESMNNGGFNLNGLGVLARSAGLVYAGYRPEDVNPNGIYVFRALPEQIRGHKPCAISFDRTGIFFVDGPLPGGRLFCPPET